MWPKDMQTTKLITLLSKHIIEVNLKNKSKITIVLKQKFYNFIFKTLSDFLPLDSSNSTFCFVLI